MSTAKDGWQFWIDRGGTFTDVVARAPNGRMQAYKLLSENPEAYEDAATEGIRRALGISSLAELASQPIRSVKMGTTVATNALLERKGDPTVLVITKGFRDALRIGYQNRPDLFARCIRLPEQLNQMVVEANERIGADGTVVTPLDEASARHDLQAARDSGMTSAAIVCLHGYRYPEHEKLLAAIAREVGFEQVSVSHEVSPLMKLVPRGDTTVVDAYLTPILRRYVDRVARALGNTRLMFMQSSGGLTDATRFQGRDSILSGPAGGVVGMAETCRIAGYDKIIGFDMGGTSTDVSHYDGEFERAFETEVAGVRMRAPMMRIHTVAAGGGSILSFDGARLRVGPDSAGAAPGPASYRRGGPLAVTDCNVFLGRIQPDFFPTVFGPDGDQPLDPTAAAEGFKAMADTLRQADQTKTLEEIAEGFLTIAVENMANAIKKISVQRGYDVSKYALCCFGGAGGQHACRVADALGMETVVIHPFAGVLSAYGMGLADTRAIREQSVEAEMNAATSLELAGLLDRLEEDAKNDVRAQDLRDAVIDAERRVQLKYKGSDNAIAVAFGSRQAMQAAFEEAHRRQFGFIREDVPLVVETITAEAVGHMDRPVETKLDRLPGMPGLKPKRTVHMFAAGDWVDAPVYLRGALMPGDKVPGPALIAEDNATTVVEPGWQAAPNDFGHLILRRTEARASEYAVGTQVDPVMLEIFNNLFMSIAEQMGAVLANTAHSVNIKERLDFSCAVFDANGDLVANAPHMPVHLGSMGESVKTVIRENPDMRPGRVYAINAPYNGGTHLPDVTVVTPVFEPDGKSLLFYVASRGHHADIGGITPGSMPPFSTTVEEEGILIDNFLLVENGRMRETALRELLRSGSHPSRNPDQNIADLSAQIAANEKGVQEINRMIDLFGLDVVQAYMGHVQDNAEESVRRALGNLRDGRFEVEMDQGTKIRVSISVDQTARRATVDFTGTSEQRSDNFNAPLPVCRAAVLYVFRMLVDDAIPLNAGCLKPIEVIAPEGTLLNPKPPAAVVAGNVETSQAIVDCLLAAMGLMAASQGTMNNLTFGNDRHQYYETICGGTGAGPDHDGTDAVQSHMTNSRLTDPEVLEWRYPVRLEAFEIRQNSGGAGAHRGGKGVLRRIEFLEPMTVSILSGRRRIQPFGLKGGNPGASGRNRIILAAGDVRSLAAADSIEAGIGDKIEIETPGGGGFGPADP